MKKRYSKSQLQELNYKWKKNTLSPQEELYLNQWEQSLDDNTLHLPEEYKEQPELIRDRITGQILSRINATEQPGTTRKLWPKITIAAAVATIIVSAGIWFLKSETTNTQNQLITYQNDVAPGKQGATLTLASGKKIKLSEAANGQLAKEAGVTISKTKNGQLVYQASTSTSKNTSNTLSTDKGETYQVNLPDGSLVVLNAASSITYNTNITENGDRRLKLSGEGYFEIAKDKAHPFIVETQNQQVEVLGTHFNINSYNDELNAKTTLLEGSVKVSHGSINKILKPGEQAINAGENIQVKQADTELATAWKNNKFIFESLSIQEIMRMIERWYNVEIIYTGTPPDNKFWGSVSRFDNVSKVLRSLESTGNVHFNIQERRIYVSR